MKRLLSVLLLTAVFLFGCAAPVATKAPESPALEFRSDFSADCGDISFGGTWDSTEPGIFKLTLTYPDTITGTAYSCDGDTVTLSYQNSQTQSLALQALPSAGLPRVLFEIFRFCTAQPVLGEPVQSGELWSFSGSCLGEAFTLQTDRSGAVRAITAASQKLEIRFLQSE